MSHNIIYRKYLLDNNLFVFLPQPIFDKILQHAQDFYPKECGGILVGRIIDNIAYVDQMILPKKTQSTTVLFKRIADIFNSALIKIFNKTKGKTYYLGDWHSHPNCPPKPSPKDYDSISEIAYNPKIRTQTPLLLIVSLDPTNYTERFFLYSANKLLQYELL